jgi:hypothetical protein
VLLVAVELSSEGMSTQEERMLRRVRSGGGFINEKREERKMRESCGCVGIKRKTFGVGDGVQFMGLRCLFVNNMGEVVASALGHGWRDAWTDVICMGRFRNKKEKRGGCNDCVEAVTV